MELTSLSVAELRALLSSSQVSPVEAVTALEERIARVDQKVHGYLSRNFDEARRLAGQADVSLPLGGVPIAIKDVINVQGEPCTAASKILRGYISNYDAHRDRAAARGRAPSFRERTNLDEFAMGSSTENSAFQKTLNPWDSSRIPGGSSRGFEPPSSRPAKPFAALRFGHRRGSIRQPSRPVRLCRSETELRPDLPLRPHRLCVLARSNRPLHQDGAGFSPAAQCHRRARSQGFHQPRHADRRRTIPLCWAGISEASS